MDTLNHYKADEVETLKKRLEEEDDMAGFIAGFLVGAVFAFTVCALIANDWHWRD